MAVLVYIAICEELFYYLSDNKMQTGIDMLKEELIVMLV